MSSRSRRGAGGAGSKEANGGEESERRLIEVIREATDGQANDEDIKQVLAECGGDVNEAVARLIDSEHAWPQLAARCWCLGQAAGAVH